VINSFKMPRIRGLIFAQDSHLQRYKITEIMKKHFVFFFICFAQLKTLSRKRTLKAEKMMNF